jgi:xylulokinase
VRHVAATLFGGAIHIPRPAEYVALGAARQAAWALSGATEPPDWRGGGGARVDAPPAPNVRRSYSAARGALHGG